MGIKHSCPVPPFMRYCSAIIPTMFDDSLSYYEVLCALNRFIQKNLVEVINNNAKVTEEYIKLVNELKEYVENYFENLDVQEEVNNKIDEMVESGEFETLISNYLIICGGNPLALGVKGDGETDDTTAIGEAITTLKTLGINKIVFPAGEYVVSGNINIPSDFEIEGMEGSVFKYVGEGVTDVRLFRIIGTNAETPIQNVYIHGITIDCTDQEYKGGYSTATPKLTHTNPCGNGIAAITARFAKNLTIEHCTFKDIYGDGIIINYSTDVHILNNRLEDVSSGNITVSGQIGYDNHGDGIAAFASYNVVFENNTVINNRVYLAGASGAIGKPCGRSGLEFEYPININYEGTPDDINHNAPDYNLISLTTFTSANKQYRIANGLRAVNNYVYGYTKGVHLEANATAVIDNNTVIHNCIGVLTSNTGRTSIRNNYIDTDGVGAAPQSGYNGYYGCIGVTSYIDSADSKSFIVDGNTIIGDGRGIVLARNKIFVTNNNIRSKYGVYQLTDTLRDIQVVNNTFCDAHVSDFTNAIRLQNASKWSIRGNVFNIDSAPTNVIYISGTTFSNSSIQDNIFNCTSELGEVIKMVDCTNCYFVNNRFFGTCTAFIRGNTSRANTFKNNIVEDITNKVIYMSSGFYRFNLLDRNVGKLDNGGGPLPNNSLTEITGDYYQKGQVIHRGSIANDSTTRGWACVSAGIYTTNAYNSTPSLGKYIVNSSNNVYQCTKLGTGTPSVEPTQTTGTIEESDGFEWKYCGAVAVLKTITF